VEGFCTRTIAPPANAFASCAVKETTTLREAGLLALQPTMKSVNKAIENRLEILPIKALSEIALKGLIEQE
jgi:hypothetical protein